MAPSSGPRGVFAAALTPLTRDLEPDLKGFVAHARWLLANGCDGLAPLGTTGEANSLSLGQRLKIIETVESALPAGKCIIGSGACALADAVHLTREILRMGAAGALILPPFYYKSPGEDGLYGFFSEVIERVGDAGLRLYLYHFPQLSAVPITLTLIERLKKRYGDVIAGLKDSGGDWAYSDALLKALPGFGVFSGSEQYLLNNLRAGGVGTISASVNVTAPLAQAVFRAWQKPEADALQKTLTAARVLFQDYPLVAALKETMALISGNDEWRNILPPNMPLSKEQRAEIESRLGKIPAMRPVMESLRAA
jgi:4-hydroxy-tetrahydrodipicolinate synthase